MKIREAAADGETVAALIRLSEDWAAENSCCGYRANGEADIVGNRIFLAEEEGTVAGYLFGRMRTSEGMRSVMPDGTPFFEVEELYVVPRMRSRGIGAALFRHAEDAVRGGTEFVVLSTAARNWRAILHFYLEELGMEFWSARLYKRLT